MKDKIKHFSKGDFQLKQPNIVFVETNLVLKIGEGEIYEGFFTIENQSDGDIRGLVYPSSFRMQCREQGFEGSPVRIHFQYDGRGLKPGHVEKGVFAIICNGGEYKVEFTAIIEKPYVMTSQGKIQDLRGFKKLAYENFDEAKKIFKSRDFYELIKYEQPRFMNLYTNMRKWNLDELGLEEFLVGVKQKEKIFLTLEARERLYKNIDTKYSDSIEIVKNTWGYLEAKVSSNCEFLEPSVAQFTTLDFNGMKYVLRYTINSTKLHAGKNFGAIIVETPFEKYTYEVVIDNSSILNEDRRGADYIRAYLLKSFLRLENGTVEKEKWKDKSLKLINELQVLEPNNNMNKLFQAQVFLINDEYNEAKWILETYNYSKFAVARNIEADAYYLYLSAIQRKESIYTKKVVEELQRLYLRNPKSWKILWMLVRTDSYYNDYYEKKHALENQFNLGANHIPIYLEAYKTFRDRPTNLKKLGSFEIQVMRFALKYKLMTSELALYMANIASQQKVFDRRIVEILEKSYEMYPEYMILSSICAILIKGNITDKRYFRWYELAIREEVKIAKLFEYYMDTVDVNMQEPLPRTILLYFAHGNSLSYEKVALLYANIVKYENENSELYACYKDVIQVFAMQQLEMRRVDVNLRVLYRKFLSKHEMNIEKIKAIYDITHAYQITTRVPNMRYVLVIASDGGIYQRIPYTNKGSQVVLDSKEDIIAWESKEGVHYVGSVKYQTERIFYESKYIEMCKNHIEQIVPQARVDEVVEPTFTSLKQYGMNYFEDDKALSICMKQLKEETLIEDKFLTHALFTLFKRECYEKVTLEYLSHYFCGSTREMKEIFYAAYDYEVEVTKLAERIISQMLFTEMVVGETEIFKTYYINGGYFRVIEAYMAFVSREYLVKNKMLSAKTVEIFMDQLHRKFEISDVVKIAMLKYFSEHPIESDDTVILKLCMQELCEKQIYFEFYMKYGKEWLREVQLWDKTLVSYTSKIGGEVKLVYQLQSEGKEPEEYKTEVIRPVFDSIYVRKFLMFKGEVLRYYFKETLEDTVLKSEKKEYCLDLDCYYNGKYGRLNDIISNPEKRNEMMTNYALEETLARKMFVPYE